MNCFPLSSTVIPANVMFSLRIDRATFERLNDLAEERGRRFSDVAREALRMYVEHQHRHGDRHVYAPRSRFLPDAILDRFERVVRGRGVAELERGGPEGAVVDVAARLRAMW